MTWKGTEESLHGELSLKDAKRSWREVGSRVTVSDDPTSRRRPLTLPYRAVVGMPLTYAARSSYESRFQLSNKVAQRESPSV